MTRTFTKILFNFFFIMINIFIFYKGLDCSRKSTSMNTTYTMIFY